MTRNLSIHRLLRAAVAAAVAIPAAFAAGTPLERRTLQARDGTPLELDAGRLEVPENRAKSDSRKITIAFVRVKSPLPNAGPPVFMLAGGPGGSSIRMVTKLAQGGGKGFLTTLGGDLVGIDQRGVGESDPNLETTTTYNIPPEQPGDAAAQIKIIREVCKAEAKRWRDQGVDLAGYTTAESAADIDAVRAALGYEKIALWGASYGSHLALATLRRHEDRIARAVLIGPEGPDHTIKLPSQADETLQRLHELIAKDDALKAQIPDFLGALRGVLAELERAPKFVEIDGTRVGLSKFDVQQVIANNIGGRAGLEKIPAMVQRMARGNFDEVARELLEFRRSDGIGSAMQAVMDSASGLSPARAARIAAESPQSLLGDAVNFPFPQVGEAWGAPDLGEEFRAPLRSKVPVLLIVGDLDSRTPVSNARELMEGMPNARMIVVENAAHDVRWLQLHAAIGDFLAGREVSINSASEPPLAFSTP